VVQSIARGNKSFRFELFPDGYRVPVTISNEIHVILHPAVEELKDDHADEGDAMYMLGRMVVAVEHLAKRMDELLPGGQEAS
jgi:hypothetical protein